MLIELCFPNGEWHRINSNNSVGGTRQARHQSGRSHRPASGSCAASLGEESRLVVTVAPRLERREQRRKALTAAVLGEGCLILMEICELAPAR